MMTGPVRKGNCGWLAEFIDERLPRPHSRTWPTLLTDVSRQGRTQGDGPGARARGGGGRASQQHGSWLTFG